MTFIINGKTVEVPKEEIRYRDFRGTTVEEVEEDLRIFQQFITRATPGYAIVDILRPSQPDYWNGIEARKVVLIPERYIRRNYVGSLLYYSTR